MLCVANLLYDTLVVEISVCVFPKAPSYCLLLMKANVATMYEAVCTIDCCTDHKVCIQWWSGHEGGASETGREHRGGRLVPVPHVLP